MSCAVFLGVFCFLVAVSAITERETTSNLFKRWTLNYEKFYTDDVEKELRFQNFKKSLVRIEALNRRTEQRGNGATYALNQFSDMSPEEFAEKVLMKPFNGTATDVKRNNMLSQQLKTQDRDVPASFDWRPLGLVTAIKDQGQCGSCWAFSVTENIESVWMKAKGITNATMVSLAPQQIVDCDDFDLGCSGGNPDTAYEYIESAGGLEPEKDYPYTAKDDGSCSFVKADVYATISNWNWATTSYDETTLKTNLVNWAPLSICVDARYWQDYQSGVMTAYECDWIVELDHCVQAVGYDTSASTPYWIVRNSWGTSWGEQGYIRLEYGYNTCGLTEEASSAVV